MSWLPLLDQAASPRPRGWARKPRPFTRKPRGLARLALAQGEMPVVGRAHEQALIGLGRRDRITLWGSPRERSGLKRTARMSSPPDGNFDRPRQTATGPVKTRQAPSNRDKSRQSATGPLGKDAWPRENALRLHRNGSWPDENASRPGKRGTGPVGNEATPCEKRAGSAKTGQASTGSDRLRREVTGLDAKCCDCPKIGSERLERGSNRKKREARGRNGKDRISLNQRRSS